MIRREVERRVVVTGIGVITACGLNVSDFWDSIIKGRSGAKSITRFNAEKLPTRIAAEIANFDCGNYISPKRSKRYDLGMQFAIAASLDAVADSDLKIDRIDADRVGLIHATSLEGMESAFRVYPEFEKFGYKKMTPTFLLNNYFGAASGELTLILGIRGHAITYSSGSASGSDVMTLASDMIKNDDVDVMVVGASEASLLIQVLGGFCNARIVTRRNDDPQGSMKAFDKDRDGFLLGEGSAFLVMEELSHAEARGAKIYAEFAGGGRACEAFHPVNIHPEGLGIKLAIGKALKNAGMVAADVNCINAHGTATDANDKVEAKAFADFFGVHSKKLAVSATKPITGHLLAAAGAIETAICALSIYHQIIPPTINLDTPIDQSLLDFVRDGARPYPVNVAINVNAGFGGKNSCVVLKRFEQ